MKKNCNSSIEVIDRMRDTGSWTAVTTL